MNTLAGELEKVEAQIITRPSDSIPKLRGGQYTAIQDEDGTWCLKRVEIFSELEPGERGQTNGLGKDWLEGVRDNMVAHYNADAQYIAPIHVQHHDRPTQDAGYFVPVSVEKVKLSNGKKLWTIFADLFHIPAEVYARIKAGRLCYRSIELPRAFAESRQIGSLALMSDEPPHFPYAMTTVGHEIKRAEQSVSEFDADKPFLFRADKGAKFMADDEEKKKKPEGDGEKKDAPPFGKEGEKKDGTEGGGTEIMEDKGPAAGQEAAEVLKVVQAGIGELKMLLTAVLAMCTGQQGNTNSISATPVQMKAIREAIATFKRHADVAEIEKLASEVEAKFKTAPAVGDQKTVYQEDEMSDPKLAAEVAAARNDIATFRKERELDRLKAFAFSELEGRNLVPETKKYIEKYITENPDEAKVKEFVNFFKASTAADPQPLDAYAAGQSAAGETLPESVVKAQSMGAEEGEREMNLFRAYEADCKRFGKRRSFEQFKKVEDMRMQALVVEQGGRGGLPLLTGRA